MLSDARLISRAVAWGYAVCEGVMERRYPKSRLRVLGLVRSCV